MKLTPYLAISCLLATGCAVQALADDNPLTEDRIAALERKINALPSQRQGEVTLRGVPGHEAIAAGAKFHVGIDFRIRFGWHMYGAEEGDNYLPTTLKWTLPEGFEVAEVRWTKPEVESDTQKPYYSRKARVVATLVAPETLPEGESIMVKAKVRWQVCKEVCRVGSAEVTLPLQLGDNKPTAFAPLLEAGPK